MKRLTARIDNGLRDYDEICFINPDDPEGAYNLDEIVIHGNYETKLAIAERLAEYEDTGLSPEQVLELKERIVPQEAVGEEGYPNCPKCGTGLVGEYCYECGQRTLKP